MKEKKPKKEKKKEKKNKIIYIDDGSTVVDMDIEGFSWHGRSKEKKNNVDRPRFKEKLAMIWGAYRAYFPALLVCLFSLALVFLIFKLWLGA